MFRLEHLKVKSHPQLGEVEIVLFNIRELVHDDDPYTSVIIGPNGTGKSFILRTISEILRELKTCQESVKESTNIAFDFDLQYYLGKNQYRIIQEKNVKGRGKSLQVIKNAYSFNYLNREGEFLDELAKTYVSVSELEFPEKLIVNSVMLTDRFVWQNSNPSDFYQYLGVRSTQTTSSTQTSARRTIKHLFNATRKDSGYLTTLKELLRFLDFEDIFKVQYSTKLNSLFFSGELIDKNFRKYYEEWWDADFSYTKRKKENPLWSIPYYNNNFKDNYEAIGNIVSYLNDISINKNRIERKPNSSSKLISVDLFSENMNLHDLEMIGHLENLDIVNLSGIKIKKKNSALSISDLSSGEYHLLISLIGMFSSISENSIVLIDEPEISLHPNWQMKYISFLKKAFKNYGSCQFIITTHSHFLISDLKDASSSVVSLTRDVETSRLTAELMKADTYGWSAEEVLYKVFNVATTRNYYVAQEINSILKELSKKDLGTAYVKSKVELLKELQRSLNNEDPLKMVVNTILSKIQNGI